MSNIPDFTDSELKVVNDTLPEHYGQPVETQTADIELRIYPGDRELTECRAIDWQHAGCHFITAKADKQQFFSPFFYGNRQQFGTEKQFYDNVFDCLTITQRIRANHELHRQGVFDK